MKWTNKGHEFDEIAKEILKEDVEYYLWGAGVYGITFFEDFKDEINIIGFIDSNEEKQKKSFCGLEVFSPDTIKKESNVKIIIVNSWISQLLPKLEEKNYILNKDFFYGSQFTSIYHMYKNNKLHSHVLCYAITQKCTLKCKNCASFIPYIENPVHLKKAAILTDLVSYFKWVDHLQTLIISGGDPMLHPDFNQILLNIGEIYYKKKISNIEILTNAIIIPSKETLLLFKKYNVFVRFTDYGKHTKGKQKIDKVIAILEENNIRYDHVKYENWLDLGYPQTSNGVEGEKKLISHFNKCSLLHCIGIYDKKIFNCANIINADVVNYSKMQKSDYFDISVYDENKKIELMEYLLWYCEKGYNEYCKKCNGHFNVNNKAIEAGEQL